MSGGQVPGNVEVAKISLEQARKFADQIFWKYQKISLNTALPNFDNNFRFAQNLAMRGHTKRHDMPVIDEKDVDDLQSRLKHGLLDVEHPYAPDTNPANPFPQGLHADQAKEFVKNGLKDKVIPDDVTKVRETTKVSGQLIPIQQQIYFDKSIEGTAKAGIESSKQFLSSSHLIVSGDNHIIDGHHRWMSACLIDPKMSMRTLEIDMDIKTLLPLLLSYSDAIGNKRNL